MSDLSSLEPYLREYVAETKATLDAPYLREALARIVPIFLRARDDDRTIFFCGNGGSASTASHFVVDIAKGTRRSIAPGSEPPRRFKCLALNDNVPSLMAWANDADFSRVFAEQLKDLAGPGDVLVAISGSGNSPNVLEAVATAKAMGLTTIGLAGIGGGKLRGMVDVPLVVPSNSMQHTEDLHLVVLHFLTAYLRDRQGLA
ncbi:MAG TPA: SIS domain-containing protein [Thermoplasmata archaeon]|jgi:D-sedoheptulose 7-phosphate isomerase|nr:SIS domain-containing protein [Thermoplasmata archaeon]